MFRFSYWLPQTSVCRSSTSLSLISSSKKKRIQNHIMCRISPSCILLDFRSPDRQVFLFPGCWLASALSPSGSAIPSCSFHDLQSKPGSEQSHCFLVDLRRHIWAGRGHGWAYRNIGLCVPSQASAVTGPPMEILN